MCRRMKVRELFKFGGSVGRRKIGGGGDDRMEKRWERNTRERRETIILHQI
jgi:hypothetical protein